jgi:hypothetical protein
MPSPANWSASHRGSNEQVQITTAVGAIINQPEIFPSGCNANPCANSVEKPRLKFKTQHLKAIKGPITIKPHEQKSKPFGFVITGYNDYHHL